MRIFQQRLINSRTYLALIFLAVLSAVCVLTPLSRATTPSSVTVNVVNNSQKVISHLYFASAGSDNWTADQLSGSISAGSSQNVSVTWSESTVQLIAEDEDGCFLTTTIDNSGSPSWTITNTTTRDCGY
jgi:hypothetical protein